MHVKEENLYVGLETPQPGGWQSSPTTPEQDVAEGIAIMQADAPKFQPRSLITPGDMFGAMLGSSFYAPWRDQMKARGKANRKAKARKAAKVAAQSRSKNRRLTTNRR